MVKKVILAPFNLVFLIIKSIIRFFKLVCLGFFFVVYFIVDAILTIIKVVCKYILFGIVYTCFLVYKLLSKVLKIFKYDLFGFLAICFMIYKFIKYIIMGFLFPFVFIFRNLFNIFKNISETKKKREEIKKRERSAIIKAKLEAQRKKDELLLAEKKRKKEAKDKNVYVNENIKMQNVKIETGFDRLMKSIKNFPKTIKEKINGLLFNSTFARNARNKKDINHEALLIDFEGEDAIKSEKKVLYEYVGKNSDGKVVKGYFAAYSKVEVHSFLLSEGFEVYSIRTDKWVELFHGQAYNRNSKVKNKDLIFFITQLSTYIKAGIPLVESLKILARQYKNKNYQRIFRTMIYDLTMGESFSEALSKQGRAFPRLLINMVKASEVTGELPEALDDMSSYYTETEKTRKQMITAMIYPAIVFVIAMAVIIFILVWVVPQFVEVYTNMDATEIPEFTLLVIGVSAFLQKNIVWFFIGIAVAVVATIYLYKNVKAVRTGMQWFVMHVPIFKNVMIYNEVTMFTKTFSSLLKHNVFITESMEILNKITNNEIYKMLILDTITNLARGEKISTSFKDHWAFPIPAYEMLVTGERTGELPEMMAKVSDYYQELHKNSVTRIKTFIEPVLIIFLTVMVGIIILAIIIPMFSMYENIQQPL